MKKFAETLAREYERETKEDFIKRMKEHENEFDVLWQKIVLDTNDFVEKNPDINMYSLQNNVEKFVDQLCLSGAWVQDRIEGKTGVPGNDGYKGSLTKKIRKALGYTF